MRTQQKKCPDCGEIKPTSQFSRHPSTADRLQTYCKSCSKERKQEILLRLHGDTRHYHLKSRYGVSAAEVNEIASSRVAYARSAVKSLRYKSIIAIRPESQVRFCASHVIEAWESLEIVPKY